MKKILTWACAFSLVGLLGLSFGFGRLGHMVTLTEAKANTSTVTMNPPPPQSAKRVPKNVAILLFEGVQIIDYTGPYEVFGHAFDNGMVFNTYTVSEKGTQLTTAMGMTVLPKYSFETCPKPDVILLPGGDVEPSVKNPKVIKWIQEQSESAEYVMSVCNGAFFLAKAGLLDGKNATTFYGMIEGLQQAAPKCNVVRNQRFTDNGKIMTTAGLSSGIDGALHLIEKVAGFGAAQNAALGMEYNWQPDSGYARASFADRYLRKALGYNGFDIPETAVWKIMGQKGDAEKWEKKWWTKGTASLPDLTRIVETKLAESWKKVDTKQDATSSKSLWQFSDENGKPWQASFVIETDKQEKGAYFLTVNLSSNSAKG